MKKKNEYYVGKHNCFLLQYHLVLVTKYRKKVIVNQLKEFLISYTVRYFSQKNFNILAINSDEDHIHIMFET